MAPFSGIQAESAGRGGWSAHLVETMTGQIGSSPLRIVGGTWSDGPLNDVSASSVHVPTADLLTYDPWWREPWSGSVLVCYDMHPLMLGPILAEPSGNLSKMILQFGGMFSIIDHRYVTDRDYGAGQGEALAGSSLTYNGPAYGSIMVDLIRRSQLRPNGWFPVRFASPQENTGRVRDFKGVDLPNAQVGKRIRELSNVINGPDVRFTPDWVRRGVSVEWVVEHGTHAMPQLAQEHTFSIDMTAPRTRIAEPDATAETNPYGRAYMFGAGEGSETHVQIVERQLPEHMPMIEIARTDSQVEKSSANLLIGRGQELVRPFRITQFAVQLVANDPIKPIWRWKVGDEFLIRLPAGLPHIPEGTWRSRAISRGGNYDTDSYSIEFQPEERVG